MAWFSFYAPLCVAKCQVKVCQDFHSIITVIPCLIYSHLTTPNAPWISFSKLYTMLTSMCLSFYYNNSIWN